MQILGSYDSSTDKQRGGNFFNNLVKQKYSPTNMQQVVDVEVIPASELALPQEQRMALSQIRKIDSNFDLDRFLLGAKKAYSIILKAVTDNDDKTLKSLIESDIIDSFIEKIKNSKMKTEADIKFENAMIYGDRAVITTTINSNIWIFTRYLTQDKIWRVSKF